MPAVNPPHHIRPHLLHRLIEPNRVAGGFVHLLALLIAHEGVAQQRLKRRDALHHRAHRQQGIEPVAKLSRKTFQHQIRRYPLLPVIAVLVVLHRRIRYNPRIQPRIAHIGNPRRFLAALIALDANGVHPRPVRTVALEGLPPGNRPLLKLLAAANHVEPAARTFENRQRQPPEAFLADHPVAHVLQPVEFLLASPTGNPLNLLDHLHDFAPPLHIDEPLIHRPKHQRAAAPPAVRVIVGVLFLFVVQALFPQLFDDRLGHFQRALARQEPIAFQINAVVANGHQYRQVQFLAQIEVFLAAARRDMHDARAIGSADFLPRNHAMGIAFILKRPLDNFQFIERPIILPADHRGAFDGPCHGERAFLLEDMHQRFGQIVG